MSGQRRRNESWRNIMSARSDILTSKQIWNKSGTRLQVEGDTLSECPGGREGYVQGFQGCFGVIQGCCRCSRTCRGQHGTCQVEAFHPFVPLANLVSCSIKSDEQLETSFRPPPFHHGAFEAIILPRGAIQDYLLGRYARQAPSHSSRI